MKMFKKSKLLKKLRTILEKEKMLANKSGNNNSGIYYKYIKATKKAICKIENL